MAWKEWVSIAALLISFVSLYFSLRREGEGRQLRVISRKHYILNTAEDIRRKIVETQSFLALTANELRGEHLKRAEPLLKESHENYGELLQRYERIEKRIKDMNLGEGRESHSRLVYAEDVALDLEWMLRQATDILSGARAMYEQALKQDRKE